MRAARDCLEGLGTESLEDRRHCNNALIAAGLYCTGQAPLVEAALRLLRSVDRVSVGRSRAYLLQRSVVTRTAPMLHKLGREYSWLSTDDLDRLADILQCAQKTLLADATAVVDAAADAAIPFALIKGTDFIHSIYPSDLTRHMLDVDLIVKPADIETAAACIDRCGYKQGKLDRRTLVQLPLTAEQRDHYLHNHYELAAFFKVIEIPTLVADRQFIDRLFPRRENLVPAGDTVFLIAQVDTHFNLSLDIDLDHVWRNTRMVHAFGRELRALSWETIVWFLAARLYVEATVDRQPTLRSLVDVAAILVREPAIEWEAITEPVDAYELHCAMYYVLGNLRALCPALVPESIAAYYEERMREFAGGKSDRGDFMPTLQGAPRICGLTLP